MITIDIMITFFLFPNLVTGMITNLGPTWTGIAFIFVFNAGDLIGRLIGNFRYAYNAKFIVLLLIGRLIFCFSFPKMVAKDPNILEPFSDLIMPLLNIFLFAFSNGLVLSNLFI